MEPGCVQFKQKVESPTAKAVVSFSCSERLESPPGQRVERAAASFFHTVAGSEKRLGWFSAPRRSILVLEKVLLVTL